MIRKITFCRTGNKAMDDAVISECLLSPDVPLSLQSGEARDHLCPPITCSLSELLQEALPERADQM